MKAIKLMAWPTTSVSSSYYRYENGLYDGVAKEFRGFGTVFSGDAGGRSVATYFHQDEKRTGRIHRILNLENYDIDCLTCDPMNSTLVEVENTWSSNDLILLKERETKVFNSVTGYEVNALKRRDVYQHDSYGNLTIQTLTTGNPLFPMEGPFITESDYNINISTWFKRNAGYLCC